MFIVVNIYIQCAFLLRNCWLMYISIVYSMTNLCIYYFIMVNMGYYYYVLLFNIEIRCHPSSPSIRVTLMNRTYRFFRDLLCSKLRATNTVLCPRMIVNSAIGVVVSPFPLPPLTRKVDPLVFVLYVHYYSSLYQ